MLGQVIHGYRVDRALSADKGGFGDVFFATHVESGAEAVVKVLKPEMSAHRDIVTRFFNEARAAASIHHPGIVQIHNVGYHGDRAYLLMERLRGDDLENRLKAGPVPLDRSILFMRQAAGAIAAAHERGIVHRDLKPANLFIVKDPDVMGGERVKVLDFGIAKLSLDVGGNKTQGVFGTPAYMSPEQCASSAEVDPRSDLYALGCIFYELVCGRPPFGHGGIELIAAHLRDAPVPPSRVSPWLPPAVEAVIMQLLEKEPARRFASCVALIAALDGVAATLPPGATPSLPPQAAHQPSYPPPASYPPARSTLGGAAGAMATTPPPTAVVRSNKGLIFALLAVAAAGVAIAVAVVVSSGGGKDGEGGAGASGGTQIAGATIDAAPAEVPPPVAVDAGVTAAPVDAGAKVRPVDAGARTRPIDAARAEPAIADPPPPPPPPPPPAVDAGVSEAPARLTDRERAEQVNEAGKKAMFDKRYADASEAFRQAIVLDGAPKYYFNLAMALYQEGKCGEARMAVDFAIKKGGADLKAKAEKLKAHIEKCGV